MEPYNHRSIKLQWALSLTFMMTIMTNSKVDVHIHYVMRNIYHSARNNHSFHLFQQIERPIFTKHLTTNTAVKINYLWYYMQ